MNNLKLDVDGQIAVLQIARPAALNALNSETLDELNQVLTEVEARDDVKVLILTGGPDKKDNPYKSFALCFCHIIALHMLVCINYTAQNYICQYITTKKSTDI